ncbi:MAG TPA: GlxA family transcriptional regulator [Thermoanaerobaculia bacterium]|nr:GlxA family transcriptional regulator [Thermoanaerobaculia bacterium]
MQRVIFAVLPEVEILDLAGPVQAFHEANPCGAEYVVETCALEPRVRTGQGLWLSDLGPLPEVGPEDLVVVPGARMDVLQRIEGAFLRWLREAYGRGAHVASVCTGAFALGEAGLLDGRQCTTHWTRLDDLQRRFPRARVQVNRLFVDDGRITTSAGIVSGIDMALAMVERRHGPLVAAAAAREMVVYVRRDGSHRQQSVYLEYRTHLHAGIHRVQDWLIGHPDERATLDDLARVAALSPRHLTRVFRQATGVSIQEFRTRLRLERAGALLRDPSLTVEAVAARCGFESARQLRRVWKEAFGSSPSAARE